MVGRDMELANILERTRCWCSRV